MRFFEKGERPRVKICGLTSRENAWEVVEAGADAIGVNFWPGSKRYVRVEAAAGWLGELGGAVCRVGLFVNETAERIAEAVDLGVLDALQVHGDEGPEVVRELQAFGLPVIRAIGVDRRAPLEEVRALPTRYVLLDTHAPGEKGGTGRTFPWELFRETAREFPGHLFLLAGGLNPGNVAEAVAQAEPHAVDVAGGVERVPGMKDPELVRALVRAVRGG